MTKIALTYKDKLLALRAIHIAPPIDLRTKLTSSEKGWITRLYNQYHEIVTAPDHFFELTSSRATALIAKSNGLLTSTVKRNKRSKIFVPRDGFDSIRLEKSRIIRTRTEKHVKKKTEILLTPPLEFLDRLKWMSDNHKLKPWEFLMVRVGNSSPFNQRFDSYDSLMNYLNIWTPNDQEKIDVIRQLILTSFYDRSMTRMDEIDEYNLEHGLDDEIW